MSSAAILRHRGFGLTYVRNITDIDDKIIRRAAENGEPIGSAHRALHRARCTRIARALACCRPTMSRAATQYVPQIITMVEELIERAYAYVAA